MNRIRDLRIAQYPKMSQEKLGQIVGVGRSTVAMWESGKSEPDNVTLIKLAETFVVSTDYLLGRDVQKEESVPKDGDGQDYDVMTRFLEQRKLHNYSQQQLANMLFVNQTAVSQWDRGVTIPSPPTLLKLSEIYGVSTDYLLGKEEKKRPPPQRRTGKMSWSSALCSMFGR